MIIRHTLTAHAITAGTVNPADREANEKAAEVWIASRGLGRGIEIRSDGNAYAIA